MDGQTDVQLNGYLLTIAYGPDSNRSPHTPESSTMQEPAIQICAVHQELITTVAASRRDDRISQATMEMIEQYRNDGWVKLAHVLNTWLNGAEPDMALLDEEDQEIIKGIEHASEYPDWLDSLADKAREEAALGIAQLIFAATWGDHSALDVLSSMREAAHDAGVEGSAAHAFVAIVEGERDAASLEKKHPQADPLLIRQVIERLEMLESE